METTKNRGSASVYMICLLIPTVISICIILGYAMKVATNGMMWEAAGLAENAVLASYNHPIKEAYGIFCYTKSEDNMENIANRYFYKSMNGHMNGDMKVAYSGDSRLSDNDVFVSEICTFMSRWDKVAEVTSHQSTYTYKHIMNQVWIIRSAMESHYNEAMDSGKIGEIQLSAEAQLVRENAFEKADTRLFRLSLNDVDYNYGGSLGNRIDTKERVMTKDNEIAENILESIDILKNVESFYSPIDKAFESQIYRNDNYMIALYAYNNFSSFHRDSCIRLTGTHFSNGDIVGVTSWTDSEFLLNSTNDHYNNSNRVKTMIFESLFAEYMVGMYDELYASEEIKLYADAVCGDNEVLKPYVKDEIISGICASLAYEEMLNVYDYDGSGTLKTYPEFIQLFDMLEVERDRDGFVDRIKYVIERSAATGPSAEAREFRFSNAYTKVTVTNETVAP